ncbi:MAG: hypothetical protein AAF481_06740 [Acidobacteriota bacterium]
MKRGVLVILLCLALGLNLGIFAMQLVGHFGERQERREARHLRHGESALEHPPQRGPWERRGRRFRESGERGGRWAERLQGRLADSLELEGDSRERFLELQQELMRSSLEKHRRRHRLEQELRQELIAETPNEARIDELIDEIATSFSEAERTTARLILESRQLLDEDQQRRYLGFLGEMRARRGGRALGDRGRRP